MITLTIDGQRIEAKKGDTILQAARRAGLYIPTMCYLSKVKPIASCRLCVVEVEGADGFILSCQAPAIEGMEVRTNSAELFSHRQNIMKLYDVNHPLECGVCDKSGACDLQNKTLEFGVNTQEFSAKDHKRDLKKWDFIGYDESLCILCEKCVHVCNEVIGDLDMPALNQQEGTFTTLNKRVVPTNVALPFNGYVLNDIASTLGVEARYTIDYTEKLPQERGFEAVCFDDIPYYFTNKDGEVRGYELKRMKHSVDSTLEEVADLPEFNGAILYRCDPVLQFGPQTYKASQLSKEEPILYGSAQFAMAAKLKEGVRVRLNVEGVEMERVFKIDPDLKGTIALNPTFDLGLREDLLSSIYRYSQSKIEEVG